MQTFLRRLSILELLRNAKTHLSTDEIMSVLVNEGYVDDQLPRKTQMRVVQRDLNFLWGDLDEDGMADNEFGLERVQGEGRTIKWRLEPYKDMKYDFEKMPQNMAIALAMTQKHLSDLLPRNTQQELGKLFAAAENKLSLDKKGMSPKDFKRFRDSIEFFQRGQSLEAAEFDMTHLDTIYRAIIQRKKLGFEYRGKIYKVNPLGVAILLPKLYLVAIKHGDRISTDSCRRFLVHKIDTVWLEPESLESPDDFSLDAYLAQGHMDVFVDSSDQSEYSLLVKVFPGHGRLIEDLTESPISKCQTISEESDGSYMLQAKVRWTIQLRNWLLSLAGSSEVIEPKLIRQGVADYLKQSLSHYSE